jgi:hypothetical protein
MLDLLIFVFFWLMVFWIACLLIYGGVTILALLARAVIEVDNQFHGRCPTCGRDNPISR